MLNDGKINIAVLVSGGGTNFQAIIDYYKAGKLKSGKPALCVASNENAYALTRAKENNIPAVVVSKKLCASQAEFEEKIINYFEEYKIELIVLAGFMSILSESFTKKYDKKIINVHPSLIPAFCGKGFYGLKVHEEVLKRGVKVTGATVHYVNEIADGGEIIAQKAVKVRKGDTKEILQRRVMEQAEWKILPEAVEKVAEIIIKKGKRNEYL